MIPDATISVRNVATDITRNVRSNSAGVFNVTDLQPSDYEMTVSASGFGTRRLTDIDLTVGAQELLNITLTPSIVGTTVEVKADAAGIDLESAPASPPEWSSRSIHTANSP